jgi:hypothetical protein
LTKTDCWDLGEKGDETLFENTVEGIAAKFNYNGNG